MDMDTTILYEVPARCRQILQREVAAVVLEAGAITAGSFASLPPEEQAKLLNILFETYVAKTNVAKSLCGPEYLIFALAKLFFKHLDLAELTPEEQAFMDRLRSIVEVHEVSLLGAENEYLDLH